MAKGIETQMTQINTDSFQCKSANSAFSISVQLKVNI